MKYALIFIAVFMATAFWMSYSKKPKEIVIYKAMNVNEQFFHEDFDSVYKFDDGKCTAYTFKKKHKCNGKD